EWLPPGINLLTAAYPGNSSADGLLGSNASASFVALARTILVIDNHTLSLVVNQDFYLNGTLTDLPGGLTQIGVQPKINGYVFAIFDPGNGGQLLMSGTYDPGDFLVIGASGLVSAPIEDGFTVIDITALGSLSFVLESLATTSNPIDFNATLSAAGQDIAARIELGALVAGSVAGSVAIIPEPSTSVMMGLGLGGLAVVGVRARRQKRLSVAPGTGPLGSTCQND
ncbi:MAG: PEP-CTERM sorting domain-containing protein, partial [Myxococcota bacterium]